MGEKVGKWEVRRVRREMREEREGERGGEREGEREEGGRREREGGK